jgi:hypothetical protein
MKRVVSLLALIIVAVTLYSLGQGGPWTWAGLTSPLPQTALFTSTGNSEYDVAISTSISGAGHSNDDEICAVLSWTDPSSGPRSMSVCAVDTGGTGGTGQSSTQIKTANNTAVSISTNTNGSTWQYSHSYNLTASAHCLHACGG